jgi:hypothetical protein
MQTNLPSQRLPLVEGLAHLQYVNESDQAELYVVLAFAMPPLMVLLMLLFLATPEQVSDVSVCGEPQCIAP